MYIHSSISIYIHIYIYIYICIYTHIYTYVYYMLNNMLQYYYDLITEVWLEDVHLQQRQLQSDLEAFPDITIIIMIIIILMNIIISLQ